MYQNFYLPVNEMINIHIINLRQPLTINQYHNIQHYIICNKDIALNKHSLHHLLPFEANHIYSSTYKRLCVGYYKGHITIDTATIKVLRKRSDNKYHAILPSSYIYPHSQYLMSFIMSVLYDKNYKKLKVNEIIEKYQISISTLYRWMHKFSSYLCRLLYKRNINNSMQYLMLSNINNQTINMNYDITTHQLNVHAFKVT